jgi:hypothetical protein
MTQDLLTVRIFKGVSIGKPFARRGAGDAEVLRQARNIVITHRNTRMAAAVARTFVAVESHDLMDALVDAKDGIYWSIEIPYYNRLLIEIPSAIKKKIPASLRIRFLPGWIFGRESHSDADNVQIAQ